MNSRVKDTNLLKIALLPAFILAAIVAAISVLATSIDNAVASSSTKSTQSMDIVDTAVAAGDFTMLVKAVQAAGLVDTLKGKGPYTVFAPTDAAFAKLSEEQLNNLLSNKEALTEVLTYHVVPGKVLANDVAKLKSAETVQGQPLNIDTSDGVQVENAKVVKADIETSNGVIHVIDTVMMPQS
jgi:uncharacterized surface protein with fasciclin (FAS1) repeats